MTKLLKNLTRCISSLLVVAIVSVSLPTIAAEPQAVPLVHEGHEGIWLPKDKAKLILKDVKELELSKKELELLTKQLTIRNQRILTLQQALELTKESAAISKGALKDAFEAQQAAEAANQSFFAGKPLFWALTGVLAGIVTTTTLALAVK